jgi:carbamoyltransferase
MGLASCRSEVEKLASLQDDGSFVLNLKYFRYHSEDIAYEWPGGEPICGALFSQVLVDTLGPVREPDAPIEDRHRNLAFATQAVYEKAFFHLLNTLRRRNGSTVVALAGGCAYNSVANGKIKDHTGFRRCYRKPRGAIGQVKTRRASAACGKEDQQWSFMYLTR